MMRKIRWGIVLLGVIVLLAAMIQNSDHVQLKLFFYVTQLPISVLLFTTSAVSFLLGAIATGRMLKRSSKSKLAAERTIEKPATSTAKTTPFS